ncbi:hypothetical protein HG536_0H02440 [Torulaspora globosa]|uniref:Uncharacterized protein n=1 Tax=Torulaspora globosa TaxID=48254 RepID=A0A7G3ZMY3_9SACH|nr:uncharacterized protein HG536_0H02440 [Torulaspora globosa]QLL34869.1 hypothetical protein HG536_0H02440 [Torulaspora globosa]
MSTVTASITDCGGSSATSKSKRTVKARTRQFTSAFLYNVPPSALTGEKSNNCKQCKLFQGTVFVEELLNVNEVGSVDHVPSYQFRFGWRPDKLFCETEIIDNIHKMNEVIKTWGDCFRVMMQCSMNRYVLLELKFRDFDQERGFRDLVCRINDEFEILAELMWD